MYKTTYTAHTNEYSGMNIIKYIQNLYIKNYKMLVTEIKDLSKCRGYCAYGLEDSTL